MTMPDRRIELPPEAKPARAFIEALVARYEKRIADLEKQVQSLTDQIQRLTPRNSSLPPSTLRWTNSSRRYLIAVMQAQFAGTPVPSLLPEAGAQAAAA